MKEEPRRSFTGPCKEKKCGDTWFRVLTRRRVCMEILIQKQCNLQGECVPSPAECSAPKKDKKDKDKEKSAEKSKDKK